LSFGLVKPRPGREELAHRENIRMIRQAAWIRHVRIAVASPKGGVGKTPMAVLLGGKLAEIRGGSVAVWDAADAANTLAARSEGTAGQCVSDLAAHPDSSNDPVPAIQSSGAHVFGSLREREFGDEDIRNVQKVLDRAAYRITIADTANTPHSDAFEAVIEDADIVVVPTIITADSVNKVFGLLRRLQAKDLAASAVVGILRYGGPETPGLAEQLPGLFDTAGVGAVVDIPFDPHIATGTELTLGALSHSSDVAWTRLAASTVANITVT
jgi:MinD-like ATPase involved in chromosome partitioning or flagellar assembly